MATAAPIRQPDSFVREPSFGAGPAPAALVRAEPLDAPGSFCADPAIAAISIELDVSVPVRHFKVRNLLALRAGDIVETSWQHSDDLPLVVGDVRLAGCEFEVVDTHLAVRVTRLA